MNLSKTNLTSFNNKGGVMIEENNEDGFIDYVNSVEGSDA